MAERQGSITVRDCDAVVLGTGEYGYPERLTSIKIE